MEDDREILSELVVMRLSRKIDVGQVSVPTLSIMLGFDGAAGSNAQIKGMMMLNMNDAVHDLLKKFVYKHGTGAMSAKLLWQKLREHDIAPAAELLEKDRK